VATAKYPLTIDPLLGPVLHTFFGLTHYELALHSFGTQIITVFSRYFAGTDLDGYAAVTDSNFALASRALVWSDINPSWSTLHGGAAADPGQSPVVPQWAVSYQREYSAPINRTSIGVYLHAVGNTTVNSGASVERVLQPGVTWRYPRISGPAPFLLVYQQDLTSSQVNTRERETPRPAAGRIDPKRRTWCRRDTRRSRGPPPLLQMTWSVAPPRHVARA
jgi:hypothetical protein